MTEDERDMAGGPGSPDEEPGAPETQDTTPEEVIAALNAKVAELKDQLLRALAEAENTRRRAAREKADIRQYAISEFAREVLGVSDNLRRALEAVPAEARETMDERSRAVIEGVEATERALHALLERHQVTPVDTSGPFDPNLHQAIAEVAAPGVPPGNIADVVQRGYQIAGRLLRPAMVTVARREPGNGAEAQGSTLDTEA